MTTRVRNLLCAVLLAIGAVVSVPANADMELLFGIYAADQRVRMTWQCGILVTAVEERMSRTLDEPVTIEVEINRDYDQGVSDVTAGLVDFARFPDADRGWVIHPDVSKSVVAAWREAFEALNFERLPYLADPHIFTEGNYAYCNELKRLAASKRIVGAIRY